MNYWIEKWIVFLFVFSFLLFEIGNSGKIYEFSRNFVFYVSSLFYSILDFFQSFFGSLFVDVVVVVIILKMCDVPVILRLQ